MLEFTGTFVGYKTGGEVPGVALTGVVEGGGKVEGEAASGPPDPAS